MLGILTSLWSVHCGLSVVLASSCTKPLLFTVLWTDPEQITHPYISSRQRLVECRLTLSLCECVWPLIRLNGQDLTSQRCFQATNSVIYRSSAHCQLCNHTHKKTLLFSQFAQRTSASESGGIIQSGCLPSDARSEMTPAGMKREREKKWLEWKKQSWRRMKCLAHSFWMFKSPRSAL